MTFQVNLTRYQVETASEQFASHIKEKVEAVSYTHLTLPPTPYV